MSKIEELVERAFFGVTIGGPLILRSSSVWLAFIGAVCVVALGYPAWKAVALGAMLLLVRHFNSYWRCVDAAVIALFFAAALYHSDVDFRQLIQSAMANG